MKNIHLKAYAKINLGLDVLRKREDNYHEVRMIMQTVNLYDKLTMKIIEKDEILLKTNLSFLPVNENNLIYKAVRLLKDEFSIKKGVFVQLYKHIPVSAGLAGGSTDCAAALIGMNRLFQLGLSKKELMRRGVTLGADVPYCLMGKTALAEGIGEILTPVSPAPNCHVLLVKPSMHVSTKFIYDNLNLPAIKKHPDIDAILAGLETKDLKTIAGNLENVLETVTIKEYPVIGLLKRIMMDCGALGSLMSGSGPTVFGLFDNLIFAEKARRLCIDQDLSNRVYLTGIKN